MTRPEKTFAIEFMGEVYETQAEDLRSAIEYITQVEMSCDKAASLLDMEEPAYLLPDMKLLYIKGQMQSHVWIARP